MSEMVEQAAAIADRLLEIGEQEFEWIKQGRGDPTRAQELLALARQAELLVSEPPALGQERIERASSLVSRIVAAMDGASRS